MVVGPCIEVKAVEGDALCSDRDYSYLRTHFAVEAVLVHAEIRRRIPKSNETWDADARGYVGSTGAVPAGVGLESATCAPSRARVSTPTRGACATAFQRKAHLVPPPPPPPQTPSESAVFCSRT